MLCLQTLLRVTGSLLLVGTICGLSGCGSPTGEVAGTITYNQKPVAGAELMFESVTNPQEQFFGASGDDGGYRVTYRGKKGMPLGRYKVVVTRYTVAKGAALPAGEEGAIHKSAGSVSKTCFTLDADIVVGKNNIDLELNTGKEGPCQ